MTSAGSPSRNSATARRPRPVPSWPRCPQDGGRVRLSEEEAQVWLRALNDVRLALGVRLSITEDFEARLQDLDPADPRSAYMWVYDWLTFLQETLVRALW